MTGVYDPKLTAELLALDEKRTSDYQWNPETVFRHIHEPYGGPFCSMAGCLPRCDVNANKAFIAAAPRMAAQLRAASEMITEYRADLDACKAVSVALQRHISQLERALRDIADYYETTFREGEIAYQAASIARAALAGEDKP